MIQIYTTTGEILLKDVPKTQFSLAWIDVVNPKEDEIEEIVRKFKINKDDFLDCLDEHEVSRIKVRDNYINIIFKPVIKVEDYLELTTLGIFIFEKIIITVRKRKLAFIDETIGEFIFRRIKNYDEVLKVIIQNLYRELSFILKSIGRKTERIEDFLYYKLPNKNIILKIWDIRDDLNVILRCLRENIATLQGLLKLCKDKKEYAEFYEDIIEDFYQLEKTAEMYLENTKSTFDALISLISFDLNIRVEKLTLITLVIEIPTLIASIYGMNFFYIPLAKHPLGFAIVTAISILLGLISYFIFKRI